MEQRGQPLVSAGQTDRPGPAGPSRLLLRSRRRSPLPGGEGSVPPPGPPGHGGRAGQDRCPVRRLRLQLCPDPGGQGRLAKLLPDYYERARAAYDRETEDLRDELGTALGLYDKDYQVWLDRQSARERQTEADRKADQWERQFAEDHDRWTAEFAQAAEKWAAQQAANRDKQSAADRADAQSYAYRMAMLALQQGLSVSDALLQTAGIDKAYAETIRRYYANRP